MVLTHLLTIYIHSWDIQVVIFLPKNVSFHQWHHASAKNPHSDCQQYTIFPWPTGDFPPGFQPSVFRFLKNMAFFNKRSLKEIARIAARICKVAPEKPGISRGPKHSTYRGYNPSYYP